MNIITKRSKEGNKIRGRQKRIKEADAVGT
jgi:hypothetical protein